MKDLLWCANISSEKAHHCSRGGAYFVTICTHQRQCLFGKIQGDQMRLSHLGTIAQRYWRQIPEHFLHVHLDEFVVMPNHLHGILWLEQTENIAPAKPEFARGRDPKSLGMAISLYKSSVTTKIREVSQSPEFRVWQRNYYEVVVREKIALFNYQQYIQQNPLKWHLDESNPQNIQDFQELEIPVAF